MTPGRLSSSPEAARSRGRYGTVTVSMPYWRTPATVRTAVEAVLAQTYPDLLLYVINDGDRRTPPWTVLADIDDPRLIRVDLPENRGRYFADAAVLAACDTTWFAIHDADDVAAPEWLEWLLTACEGNGWDACFAPQNVVGLDGASRREEVGSLLPVRRLRHIAHHAAVYRTQALRDVGGPHPGFRIGYDTLLVNLLTLRHPLGTIDRPVYTRHIRPGSLTTTPETASGSPARRAARRELQRLYALAWLTGPKTAITPTIAEGLSAEVATAANLIAAAREETAVTVVREPVWGKWALDAYAAHELRAWLARELPRQVVEFGSGMSTVLLAEYARDTGATITSFEHSTEYAGRTKEQLDARDLGGRVDLRLCSISDIDTPAGRLPWYRDDIPDRVDFALVDGPPGETIGRKAAFFALAPKLTAGRWEVWLDDALRPGEIAAVDLWRRHSPAMFGVEYVRLPKGLARLYPTFGDDDPAGPRRPVDASDVAVTIVTGGRPDLLANTIGTLQACAPGLLETAHVAVLENGVDTVAPRGFTTADVLNDNADLIDVHTALDDRIPVGTAAGALLGFPPPRPYTLHLEDDWIACTTDETWLTRARAILAENPDLHQVRLRHAAEPVMTRHMLTRRPLHWDEGPHGSRVAPAHYTLNPSLMRSDEVAQLWPADTENGAARQFYNLGWRVAQLEPGVFRHIGDGASLRLGQRP